MIKSAMPAKTNRFLGLSMMASAFLFVALLLIAYSWVSGKPVSAAAILGPIIGSVCGVGLLGAFSPKKAVKAEIPGPMAAALADALRKAGLESVRISYRGSGPPADLPRPLALGTQLMMSRRILEEFSEEALIWSAKTDALAANRFTFVGLPLTFLVMGGGLLSVAFGERYRAPNIYYFFPFSLFLLSFVVMGVLGYSFQLQADRKFTVTEGDRRAAKEALSYPYFAQAERARATKWAFFSHELKARATRLGIVLERGYRASARSS